MKFGYTLFYVDDVKKSMTFYHEAFGLQKGFLHESGQYGEMVTGETKIGFVGHAVASSNGFDYQKKNLSDKPLPIEIGFVTQDVSSAYQKALSAGATSLSSPTSKPWGQVVSYVKDCNGNIVEICSPINLN